MALFASRLLLALLAGPAVVFATEEAVPSISRFIPHFIPDTQCTPCHAGLVQDFPSIGMARSFGTPEPPTSSAGGVTFGKGAGVEDWSRASFEHAASADRYRFAWRADGRLWFERWQTDTSGAELHRVEIPVDFVLGSGNRSRVYLYRTPSGELFQLPLAWYSQERAFAMAPGFERRDHEGIGRRVRRECMFCHAANPETTAGDDLAVGWDARHAPQTFPRVLPHGIGCQRCHGPGSRHAALAWSGTAAPEVVRAAIVNPARLDPARARDVCFQCHLQPSVAQPGLRRIGRSDYAFRPGERLSDSILAVRVAHGDSTAAPTDRFEINHHATRLIESRCFLASPESGERGRVQLACFFCHDPHKKPSAAERAARVSRVCSSCHPNAHAADKVARPVECSSCHMPERRPRDVVRVTMTDHKIVRHLEPSAARLAPLAEEDPVLLDVELLDRAATGLDAEQAEFYRVLAVVRAQGRAAPAAVDRLASLVGQRPEREPEVLLDLAGALLARGRFRDAEPILTTTRARLAGLGTGETEPLVPEWLGLSLAGQGRTAAALIELRPLASLQPPRPEALYNLALVERAAGDPASAVRILERVVALRPYQALAWLQLGLARREAAGEAASHALAAFERAVAVEPASARATVLLAEELERLGRKEDALRVLRHGLRVVRDPTRVRSALTALEAGEAPEPFP